MCAQSKEQGTSFAQQVGLMVDLLLDEWFGWAPVPSLQAQGPCTQLAKPRLVSGGIQNSVPMGGG